MNLLNDVWLLVIRENKEKDKIAIWQILDNYKNNPVIDIEAPRPDFRNAIYQLLIGIMQVAAMPEDEQEWGELWNKPFSKDDFKNKLLKYKDCFEIDTNGPAFMQDLDNLKDRKKEELKNLFIELPANTVFNKNTPCKVDIYWIAIVLYTLQTFASGGGRGQNTGIRGGGPMTTMLYPAEDNKFKPSLWQKLWLNILPKEQVRLLTGDITKNKKCDVFPWMKQTKVSDKKGNSLFASECHPFHMYFGMPRRIRLFFTEGVSICDISGVESNKLADGYCSSPSGNHYSGVWIHPLNAYRKDPKKPEEPPNPYKGNPGGISYRHWTRLALNSESDTDIQAPVVSFAQSLEARKKILKNNNILIWAAGYDNDKMKARCWYDAMLPVYSINIMDAKMVEEVLNSYVISASLLVSAIKREVKYSWFKAPAEAKGDFSFVDTAFWHDTESSFYRILSLLIKNINDNTIVSKCTSEWLKIIRNQSIELFDTWALSEQEEGINMKRVVHARNRLFGSIKNISNKYLNSFIAIE